MPEATFSVTYQGPAVAEHRMDVTVLAPALLSLADVYRIANDELNPSAPDVNLEIRATSPSSFLVDLALVQPEAVQGAIEYINDSEAMDAVIKLHQFLTAVVGGTFFLGIGLVAFIKKVAGRPEQGREQRVDGTVVVTLVDGTRIEVSNEVLRLYDRVDLRQRLAEVTRPLESDGIDSVQFSDVDTSEPAVTVTADEAPHFRIQGYREELTEHTAQMVLEIVSPSFREGNKWRVSDGQSTFHVAVEDQGFLQEIDQGHRRFGKGDRVVGLVSQRQYATEHGLDLERALVQVQQVIPAAENLRLPLDEE